MSSLRTARFSHSSAATRVVAIAVLVLSLVTVSPTLAQNFFGPSSTSGPDPITVGSLLNVSDVEIQALDKIDLPFSEVLMEVELAGDLYTLSMSPYSIRSDLFEVLVDDGTGVLKRVEPPPIRTRRGVVLEIPGSQVRASFDGVSLKALITTPNGAYGIQPIADLLPGFDPRLHAVYEAGSILPTNHTCATTGTGGTITPGGGFAGPIAFGGPTLTLAEIAADADFEFFQDNSNSVPATVAEIESIINGVENAYDNSPILIGYELTTVIVRTTSNDPYGTTNNEDVILDTFRSVWQSSPENQIQRDVAHLFTGVNLSGTTIGVAQLSEICTSFSYGLSWASFTNNTLSILSLVAHELGHNWAATHCNGASSCRIMCDNLGGCNGISPLTFAPTPESQIISYRNSRNCLSTRPAPASLPFFEDFPTSTLDQNRWIHNNGGIISTQGVNEPSAPLAIVLDASGSGAFQDDELRSNFINMVGASDPHLSFFAQHRGVEAGEELVVEWQNSSLVWLELDRIVSTGATQSEFVQYIYDLPPTVQHANFRIRFRTEVNASNDDWYLDDILIDEGPPIPPPPPTLLAVNPNSDTVFGGRFVTIIGIDFRPDAFVTFGTQLLENQVFVDDTTITGNAPAQAAPGLVTVSVSQSSGVSVVPGAFNYTAQTIQHQDASGPPGGSIFASVTADHELDLSGYSAAVDYDASLVETLSITLDGTAFDGADFFVPNIDNTTGQDGGWWTVGVVLSLAGSGQLVPASPSSVLAIVEYQIDAALPLGLTVDVTPLSGVGFPPTDNLLVDPGGVALQPLLIAGELTAAGVSFIRGDRNGDGAIDIADAVGILGFLFSGETASCLDALDSNDDGGVNIADAIYLLDFLFTGGSPPPAPHPNAGADPTADTLDCT